MPSGKRRQSGFLLVTVVVLLAVVSLMLARLAVWSMQEASSVLEDERILRQKWTATTLQAYCLGNAERLLVGAQGASDSGSRPGRFAEQPPLFSARVQMNGIEWDVLVADESTKVNLNRLAEERPANDIQKLVDDCVGLSSPIRLKGLAERPTLSSGRSKRFEKWFHCPVSPHKARHIASGTSRLTFWGDGRVNLYRADDVTIDALWRCLFGRAAPDDLHTVRKAERRLPWEEIVSRLALRDSQRAVASRWFGTESRTASVWLFSNTDRRIPSHFFVRQASGAGSSEQQGIIYD